MVKNPPAIRWITNRITNLTNLGSVPGLGRSPGGGRGNAPLYSYLENPRGQRSLACLRSMGSQESDTAE